MTEEITDIMQRFALSSSEIEGAELEVGDATQGRQECLLSLFGRVLGEKPANFTGLRKFVTQAWGYPKNLTVAEIGPNAFQFTIPDGSERARILNGGPWILDNQLLTLRSWYEGIEEDPEAFRYAPFWIQVWNLPIHWISQNVGRKIGSVFEEVKEVIIPQSGGKEGKHMKLLVMVDTSKPLMRGTTVKMEGITKWAKFRYERCPDFCYRCGRIGHSDKTCQGRDRWQQEHQGNQYGPWMRAFTGKRSPQKERNEGNASETNVHWGPPIGELRKNDTDVTTIPCAGKHCTQESLKNLRPESTKVGNKGKDKEKNEKDDCGSSKLESRAHQKGIVIHEGAAKSLLIQETDKLGRGTNAGDDENKEGQTRTRNLENSLVDQLHEVVLLQHMEMTREEPELVKKWQTRCANGKDQSLSIQRNKENTNDEMHVEIPVQIEKGSCSKNQGKTFKKITRQCGFRQRQPLKDIGNGGECQQKVTKRKFQLRDEEMVDSEDRLQNQKRSKSEHDQPMSMEKSEGERSSLLWASNQE